MKRVLSTMADIGLLVLWGGILIGASFLAAIGIGWLFDLPNKLF